MIIGLHVLASSTDPVADREFLRDVLGRPFVEDAASGDGWLIFRAPPTEVAVHPSDEPGGATLHLVCDDVRATVNDLRARGIGVGDVVDEGYGLATKVTMPSGAVIGSYEPRHVTALHLQDRQRTAASSAVGWTPWVRTSSANWVR